MEFLDNSILMVLSNALLLLLLIIQNISSKKKLMMLSSANASVTDDLSVLCRGATNIDRRLELLGSQVKRLMERQDHIDAADSVKKEYDHAIRAIKNGASFDRLINLHGLSRAEARLLVSLHTDECGVQAR